MLPSLARLDMEKTSTQFWRNVIYAYVRFFPVNRGKRRIMELTAPLYAGSDPQLCELPGGARLRADLGEHVQRWIYFFGLYEEATVRWFRSFLRPGMVVLDVGAHVGQYSLLSASCVGPTGRVHSFKPNLVTYRLLSNNLALNDFRNVTAISWRFRIRLETKHCMCPGMTILGKPRCG